MKPLVLIILLTMVVPSSFHLKSVSATLGRDFQRTNTDASILKLLEALKSRDENTWEEAADALTKLGSASVPPLEHFLQKERQELYQFRAVLVLTEVAPDHPAIIPTLLKIAKGRRIFDSEKISMMRRSAGMSLAGTPAGIQSLVPMLKDKDAFVRRSAAFAFDDPTEVLGALPQKRQAAINDALPALVAAIDDKDEVVSRVCCEVVNQIIRSKIEPLTSNALRLVRKRGKPINEC
ncbi:MAG: hypothetical protein ABJC05_06180 [Pyrinomonadaceae bacterium]